MRNKSKISIEAQLFTTNAEAGGYCCYRARPEAPIAGVRKSSSEADWGEFLKPAVNEARCLSGVDKLSCDRDRWM